MRRRVILIVFLCLCAGALAVAQAFHLPWNVDTIFGRSASSDQGEVKAPQTAVDMSPASTSQQGSSDQVAAVEHQDSSGESAPQPSGSAGPASQSAPSSGDTGKAASGDDIKLDLAEISTSGSTSVFAGRATPGAPVTVFENGVAVATAKANANGDWSIATDHKFAGPDPKFSLRTGTFKIADETADQDQGTKPAAAAAPDKPAGQTASAEASPARELLKNFEAKVASVREEEKKSAAESSAPQASASSPPSPPPAAPAAQAATDSPKDVNANEPAKVSELSTPSAAPTPSTSPSADQGSQKSASIPVPMTFVFDEATMTADGEKTAKLLLEYLQLKKYASVTLTGHADERGTAEYNMDLSRKRLDTVSEYLRSHGYEGKLDLIPKGATEPFTGVDRSKYSHDDLMQLDRRVELRNAS